MRIQSLIIIGSLLLISSCKQNDSKKIESIKETIREIKVKNQDTKELTSIPDSYIENDSLTTFLISELGKMASNPKFSVEKKLVKNIHVNNLIDTLITRTFKSTRLTSYKTVNKEIFQNAKIENTDFELANFIRVGTKKYLIEKSLEKDIPSDVLKIRSSEGLLVFSLKFESEILKKIEFEGYSD